ncbi:MAG: hypothetical protein DMG68_09870 [Acidobacteria bacterium]|nr:MAG: hypothetical protein DMG68_09870 [Acidobacteriota bacterium]
MASSVAEDFIETVAMEMCSGIDAVVEGWMAEFESILQNPQLTTLGRLQEVSAMIARYKAVSGKSELRRWVH